MRILLLAPDLLAETLALQLTAADHSLEVMLRAEQLAGHPALVIWSLDRVISLTAIEREARRLQERWQPAPLLLLLPADLTLDRDQILSLPAAGLLQNADLATLQQAVATVLGGGRVVDVNPVEHRSSSAASVPMGLGQWLLVSGLQQISQDLQMIEALLTPPPADPLLRFLLAGRRRELTAARSLLLWIWGPLQLGLQDAVPLTTSHDRSAPAESASVAITLRERNAIAVWGAIRSRLDGSVQAGLTNATGGLLALEGLNPERRRQLLLALLQQLDLVLARLRGSDGDPVQSGAWAELQPELRRQALTTMAGSYVRLPREGTLLPVAESLLGGADFSAVDGELPDPSRMLTPLLVDQPVLVNGQLLPAHDPRALLQLETLVSNWLVRTAELISAELLDACGAWPELRRYLLGERYLATRELERLRNQLNTQWRWEAWIERPVQLYESRRVLFQLRQGRIEPLQLTEPRDQELNQLGWWQRQVALLLETRDALAPQVQALVQRIGDLAVVLLTQVVGRAIGLIGRGIAQGMGRSLGRG